MEIMAQPRAATKRHRSPSVSSSASGSSSTAGPSRTPSPSPPPKYHRATPQQPTTDSLPYTCNLPPTCSQPGTATAYATLAELDRHQQLFHRWVCRTPIRDRSELGGGEGKVPEAFVSKRGKDRWKECGKMFPDERLLNLHQTETHDPIARERQARGEKIFACFVPESECGKRFASPLRRRQHLIQKHHYPRDYFFSITNHGLNELAKQDGLGISLIRPRKDPASAADYAVNVKATSPAPQEPSELESGEPETSREDPDEPRGADVDMEDLTKQMQGLESSLQFLPRGVRRKGK